ncbi:MAG: N-acetylneuraminate synthase [Deltaproteobacteria bacterium]|nr:MAG: N-acetylneuraminate synthase [Deltaproteobacteria bacterium]
MPCFVIAEAGVNHNGSRDLAMKLIDAAAAAGADAVKFQTFMADRLVAKDAPKAGYQARATGSDETQYEMLKRLELTEDDHRALIAHCGKRDVLFLSTPFDEGSCDFLESLGIPAFKIPSGELTNLPFLAHVAGKGRPVVLSTGMATLREVDEAVAVFAGSGNDRLALLQCVSEYPADPKEANLRAMASMRAAFGFPVGFSDHTPGIAVAVAAAALGACVLEKHFTLDRAMPGPDHRASIEPKELAEMVRGIRIAESALGDGEKRPAAGEGAVASMARKSLVAACDIPAGTLLGPEHIAAMRPGTGISPALRERLLGRRVRVAVPSGTPLDWEMLG